MQCPFCGQDNDKVTDSRAAEGASAIRRRRQCQECDRKFTTYERVEETVRIPVIKKDESREPYQRNKIIDGLRRACYKRKVTDEQIMDILEHTEESIFRNFEKEVPSTFIGDEVSRALGKIDKIAYIRFASVYREFTDVGELINEARGVQDAPAIGPEQKELFNKFDKRK